MEFSEEICARIEGLRSNTRNLATAYYWEVAWKNHSLRTILFDAGYRLESFSSLGRQVVHFDMGENIRCGRLGISTCRQPPIIDGFIQALALDVQLRKFDFPDVDID